MRSISKNKFLGDDMGNKPSLLFLFLVEYILAEMQKSGHKGAEELKEYRNSLYPNPSSSSESRKRSA